MDGYIVDAHLLACHHGTVGIEGPLLDGGESEGHHILGLGQTGTSLGGDGHLERFGGHVGSGADARLLQLDGSEHIGRHGGGHAVIFLVIFRYHCGVGGGTNGDAVCRSILQTRLDVGGDVAERAYRCVVDGTLGHFGYRLVYVDEVVVGTVYIVGLVVATAAESGCSKEQHSTGDI